MRALLAALLLTLAGCSSFEGYYGMTEQQWRLRFAQQDGDTQSCIKLMQVRIGMTPEQVVLSWGQPRRVNRQVGATDVVEQWAYPAQFLFFRNRQLVSVTTLD